MPKRSNEDEVNLNESSVYRDRDASDSRGDTATDADLDRLESLTGGAEDPEIYRGALGREFDKLDASTDEEIDALEVNLNQDDDSIRNTSYGTGLIDDDLAAESVEDFTESGPDLTDKGVNSLVPGRDDTSATLRHHHPNTEIARAQDVVEGNLDEPRDEARIERKVDEGTGA